MKPVNIDQFDYSSAAFWAVKQEILERMKKLEEHIRSESYMDWGYVSSLSHVNAELYEVNKFLGIE